jgi:hypothetical protein
MSKKTVKRNLFAELTEGFDALAGERAGKQTLRTHAVTTKPVVPPSADELVALRAEVLSPSKDRSMDGNPGRSRS